MSFPHSRYENKLGRQGFRYIAGVDEVGRGALAGPIVAAAVILPLGLKIPGIKDSKSLTPQRREELSLLIEEKALVWSVRRVSQQVIDRIGIQEANLLAFKGAIKKLKVRPEYLLIDGLNLSLAKWPPHLAIIRGDFRVCSIAAASILAKVTRDRILIQAHREYPQYGFAQHKGYGTYHHFRMIERYGLCPLHRRSFRLKSSLERKFTIKLVERYKQLT